MSQTLSPSVARCYGLARVARVWSISRASAYRALKDTPNTPSRRPGPVGACVRTPNWHGRSDWSSKLIHGLGSEAPAGFRSRRGDGHRRGKWWLRAWCRPGLARGLACLCARSIRSQIRSAVK
jgi:hypothetical protein